MSHWRNRARRSGSGLDSEAAALYEFRNSHDNLPAMIASAGRPCWTGAEMLRRLVVHPIEIPVQRSALDAGLFGRGNAGKTCNNPPQ